MAYRLVRTLVYKRGVGIRETVPVNSLIELPIKYSPLSQRPTPSKRSATYAHHTDTVHTTLSNTLGPASRTCALSCSWSGAPPLFRAPGYLQGTSAGQRPAQAKTRRHTRPTLALHTHTPLAPSAQSKGWCPLT